MSSELGLYIAGVLLFLAVNGLAVYAGMRLADRASVSGQARGEISTSGACTKRSAFLFWLVYGPFALAGIALGLYLAPSKELLLVTVLVAVGASLSLLLRPFWRW
jgi:hypothetical protein